MKNVSTRIFAAVVFAGVSFSLQAATTYTWTGAEDNTWNKAGNWKIGETTSSSVPGSGDTVTFGPLGSDDPVTIDLADMTAVKTVTIKAGAPAYTFGTASSTAQGLLIENNGSLTIETGVTTTQTVMSLAGYAASGATAVTVTNNSSAPFIYKGFRRKSGGYATYNFYGTGDFTMDGPTSFDQVSALNLYLSGKFTLGDTSSATGSRISIINSYANTALGDGYRQIEIPAGRYENSTGGGWSSSIFSAQANTRIYGEGVILARYNFNCNTVAAQEYSANFSVSSGKTLKIESYIRRDTNMKPWGGPGVFGAGTLYLCSSNNLVGQARIQDTGTLAVDKIGLKGCAPDESNLGTGDGIRYMNSGTLEYRGAANETTDRDLIVSNNTAKVTMTLANASVGTGTLTWTGTAKQMYAKADCYGARVRFAAKTQPIVCNGDFESGKDWGIEIAGPAGVTLMKDYGAAMPVILAGGKLNLSSAVPFSSPLSSSAAGSVLNVAADTDLVFDTVPGIGPMASLDIVLPESSTLTLRGKPGLRLDGITVNGVAARTDENGKIVPDGRTYGTAIWTSVSNGSFDWTDETNWQDAHVAADYDSVVVTNDSASSPTYTINLDAAARLQGMRSYATAGGKQTMSGSNALTLGSDGYVLVTNATASAGHDKFDGGPFNFDVPLHLAASQRWLLGSKRGPGAVDANSVRTFTKDLSSEADIVWELYGYARYRFTGGNSAGFDGTAKVGTFVQFQGTNQFHRLGRKGVTLACRTLSDADATAAGTTRMSPGLTYKFLSGETNATISTPISVDVTTTVTSSRGGWCHYGVPICMQTSTDSVCAEPHTLTFTGGLSGNVTGSSCNLIFAQSYADNKPAGTDSYNTYPEDQKIVLAGDGGQLTGNAIRTFTMLEIAHPHAVGRNNGLGVFIGMDGYWGTQPYSTIQGVFLRPGLTFAGAVSANGSTDKDGIQNRIAYMLVGSAATPSAEGATEATFTGAVSESGANGFRLRLTAAKDTTARFKGKISTVVPLSNPYGEHPDIVGLGDVVLANASNSFATNLCVRSGRLVLEANGAGGSKPIWLGGFVPTLEETKEVRCVNANMSFTPTISSVTAGDKTLYGKRLTLKSAQTFDGVTPEIGDYVLISRPRRTAANGLWKVTENPLVWERPDELDEPDDLVGKVGLRLKVREGARFGGKAFMLITNPVYYRKSVSFNEDYEKFNSGDGAPVFHPEPAADPDVALLAGTNGMTVACNVEVTDNASSGASIIGSKLAGSTAGFSGAIHLAKSVTLAAATDSTVTFTGSISGAGDIIGGGAGVSDVTGATVSIDGTNGFKCVSGTLKVTAEQLGTRPLVWVRTKDGEAEGTGLLDVTGDLDLSVRTVSFENFALSRADGDDKKHERKWPIATATGTITLPTSVPLPRGWKLSVEEGTLYATFTPSGVMLIFR